MEVSHGQLRRAERWHDYEARAELSAPTAVDARLQPRMGRQFPPPPFSPLLVPRLHARENRLFLVQFDAKELRGDVGLFRGGLVHDGLRVCDYQHSTSRKRTWWTELSLRPGISIGVPERRLKD